MTLPLKLGTGRLAVAAGLTSALVLANPAPSQAAGMAPAAAPGLGFGAVLPIQAPAAPGPNVEANLAQLHQRLQITPVQQAKFDTFANVMRENSRMAPAPAPANPTAVEDLRLAIHDSELELLALKRLLPAMQALYASLTPAQQKTADQVFRQGAPGE